ADWAGPTAGEPAKLGESLRAVNYGFRKVELLAGNIGYIDLIGFAPADVGWETAAAAMRFVADTDALIIDLRDNQGGSPEMVALICSYLFDNQFQSVHLNDIYSRVDNATHQFWTLPYVPGKRYADKPVYVLTGKQTFSSA